MKTDVDPQSNKKVDEALPPRAIHKINVVESLSDHYVCVQQVCFMCYYQIICLFSFQL